jgi:DNA-binding IclR family transcriptional regulator
MRFDVMILRAMLRLARRRQGAELGALQERVGGTRAQIRAGVRRLERAGLVFRDRSTESARLTLEGFAVALATIAAKVEPRATAPRRAASTRAA